MLNTLLSFGQPHVVSFKALAGLSISLFALAVTSAGQNLVPNWSFEDTGNCDSSMYWPIQKSPPWFSANYATPDVYSMDLDTPCGVAMDPSDFIGEQCYQAAYHGIRFAGEYLWKNGDELKEYMEIGLTAPLEAGHSYRVAMEISFPDCYEYAVDRIGAYFSTDTVFDPTQPIPGVLSVIPQAQFHAPAFFTNTIDWTQVEDTIVATGGERFMVIGSFTDNANTNVQFTGQSWPTNGGYYYFDAIEVEEIVTQGIASRAPQVTSIDGVEIVLTWPGIERIDAVLVQDLLGRMVKSFGASGQVTPYRINLPPDLAVGTYVLMIQSGQVQATARWTKMR